MPTIHIITIKPLWYDDSAELRLAFRLFRQNLPKNYDIHFILIETDTSADTIAADHELNSKIAIALNGLEQTVEDKLIIFVKEPAILLREEVILRLINLLNHEDIDCVVPASYPYEYPESANQQYFTLQGYQYYVSEHLKSYEKQFIPYDKRPVNLFAIKFSVIAAMNLQDHFFNLPVLLSDRTVISLGAYIHPFSDYFNGANEEMIELIPMTSKSLLDIGCSSGEFGQAVIQQRQITVHGIEINAAAAKIATTKIDKVYTGNALQILTEQRYDCVTCLDVLEHFSEPDVLLRHIANMFLKDKGTLLLNLPNVGHWSIVEDLLNGHWDYLPGGTLCNTHVRFFTRHTIIDLLENNGFVIETITPVKCALPEATERYLSFIESQQKPIDRDSLETVSFRVIAQKHID